MKGSCHSCVQTDILFALFPFKRRMAQKMPRKHAFFDSKKNNCVCARKKSYVVLVFTTNFRCRSLQHAVHMLMNCPPPKQMMLEFFRVVNIRGKQDLQSLKEDVLALKEGSVSLAQHNKYKYVQI